MIKKDIVLAGKKIYLRDVKLSDVNKNYIKWMNDKYINQFMETRFRPHTLSDIQTFVNQMMESDNVLFLAIVDIEINYHIGNIKLGPISKYHQRGDISFFIGEKDYWGKGIASEAVSLLTDYGLNQLNLIKICAGSYSNNIGSIKVFEKLGFIKEGILKKQFYSDGDMVDEICFAKFSK